MKTTQLQLFAAVCMAIAFGLAGVSINAEEPDNALVDLVVGLLHDSDKDIRALAFEQVRSEAPGAAATKVFAAQLAKLPTDAQVGLLSALADRGDAAARPAVFELLSASHEASVKSEAIAAIGALGEPADARLLVEKLSSAPDAESTAARAALIRLRGESVPKLIAAELQPAAAPLRVTLVEILAARRGLDAIPDILSLATDADPAVRAAAMTALGQLAGPEQIPGMVRGVLAAEPGREREAAEKCVMFVCNRITEPDERAEPLLAAIENLGESDKIAMLSTLGRVGGPAALKMIEAAIADSDPLRHETGLRALCNWPDASIAPRLIELANADEHASHRIAALRALIRVAPLPDDRTDEARLALLQKAMTMCTRDDERLLILDRARAIRTLATLHFIEPFMDQPAYAEQACLSIVELAHHRTLRQPNKAEFHRALDKVIATSKDSVVVDRANRYKKDQTWVRPAKPK